MGFHALRLPFRDLWESGSLQKCAIIERMDIYCSQAPTITLVDFHAESLTSGKVPRRIPSRGKENGDRILHLNEGKMQPVVVHFNLLLKYVQHT